MNAELCHPERDTAITVTDPDRDVDKSLEASRRCGALRRRTFELAIAPGLATRRVKTAYSHALSATAHAEADDGATGRRLVVHPDEEWHPAG